MLLKKNGQGIKFKNLSLYILCLSKTRNPFTLSAPALTSTSVSQQVAVDILDVGVDGGPTWDAAWGHVWISLRVDILETLPGNTRAEL